MGQERVSCPDFLSRIGTLQTGQEWSSDATAQLLTPPQLSVILSRQ